MEEAWGFRELRARIISLGRKQNVLSLCSATRQLCDLVKVVLPWALVFLSLR